MALESFYGGKQGVSPVIKASFEYVSIEDPAYRAKINSGTRLTKTEAYRLRAAGIKKDDNTLYNPGDLVTWTSKLLVPLTMNECFKNVDYTDVWYNELCIIDTQNKLNPNNGKIFRRTLKRYQNPNIEGITDIDALYAEYIGQIVGPSGGIPNLDLGNLNAERQKAVGLIPTLENDNLKNMNSKDWDYAYPIEEKDELGNLTGNFVVTTENPINASVDDNPETPQDESKQEAWTKIPTLKMNNGRNIEMVPGKIDDNNYNDTIEYTWCNVRRNLNNSNEDSAWIYLGFKIPYVSYDVKGYEENYTYKGDVFIDHSSTPNSPSGDYHPFSKEYAFHIPRGARGIGPEEIFIVGKDGKSKPETLYDFDAITYTKETDKYSISTNASPVDPENNEATKRPHKRDNNNQIIADQYIDKTSIYWVAKWRLYNPKMGNAEPISIYQYLGSYKEIKSISVDTNRFLSNGNENLNYGQMYVTYTDNNNKIKINNKLPLPKEISYKNDGTLEFTMADGATIITDGNFKEIESIVNDPNNTNKLIIKYTNNTTQSIDIPLPTDINTNDIEINTNSGNNYLANKTIFKEITLNNINDNDDNNSNDTPLKKFWELTVNN